MHNNYITCIVAMRLLANLTAALSTGVAAMSTSSLVQLQVRDTDPEKQRQCRCDGTRLTEIGNARSELLLMMPTESLEWLPGELLSGSEGPAGF